MECRNIVLLLIIVQENVCSYTIQAKLIEMVEPVIAYLRCDNETLDMQYPPAQWDRVMELVVTSCSPDVLQGRLPKDGRQVNIKGVFAQVLEVHGIKSHALKKLSLKDVPESARFNASHFMGLKSLEQLNVQAAGEDRPEQLARGFLTPLQFNLTWLLLENEAVQPLESLPRVSTAILFGGRSLGSWGSCRHLHYLRLRDWIITPDRWTDEEKAAGWLAPCGVLNLKAERMELQSLKAALFGARDLVKLQLRNNQLTSAALKEVFKQVRDTSRKLTTLDVSQNKLTDTDAIALLYSDTPLESLNLSLNKVHQLRRTLLSLHALPSVRRLWIDHNPLDDFCDLRNYPVTTDDVASQRLTHLSLVSTNISRLCFSHWGSLHSLNLTDNNIEVLQFGQLPLIGSVSSLTVDLRNNPLRKVDFNEPDYYALKGGRQIDMLVNGRVTVLTDPLKPFNCNCHNAWLARALRERRVELSANARCHGGLPLSAVKPDDLECDPIPCAHCRCHLLWSPRVIVVHCEAIGLQEIPEEIPDPISELHLRGNHINTIRVEEVPDTLILLDVRGNNISRVDTMTSSALFSVTERRVYLSGNPIACDCDNWPLLGALQAHSVQVADYDNVSCASGRMVHDVSENVICGSKQEKDIWVGMVALGGALFGLLALLGALYMRYDRQLKVWLYSRGWCLICVREEELDSDREYDAFVSFAHGDYEFVADKLLPKLEGDSCGYKVCVHYRDWMPGELIPTQIIRSVAASRRTIIILSTHFVQSVWGLLEFRTAHVSAMSEGRVRVLVVALDDAPSKDELPEELKLYLRSTTYLRWDDPWFWDKLHYALPHRTKREIRRITTACVAEPEYNINLML